MAAPLKVLVTGASGVLGSRLVSELERRGHHVLKSSRTAREGWLMLDALRPATFDAVPMDLDAVVHCAATGNPSNTLRVEGQALVALRKRLPNARLVYPSVVGCDEIRAAFFQGKASSETLLVEAGGNHAILRFTQFHEFVDRLARLPLPISFMGQRAQTLAATEAAIALADAADGQDVGRLDDMGGPEEHAMIDLVKQRLRADGRRRWVLRVPVAVRDLRAGRNLVGPETRRGRITWQEHLREDNLG